MQSDAFREEIYALVRLVPYGRVSTYGHIAKALGRPGAARQIGYALNACHTVQPVVPAHRIVNRIGLLSGKHHFGEEGYMQSLLEAEGIQVVNDIVQNFERVLWDPLTELSL